MSETPATLAQGVEHSATLTELGAALAKAQAGFAHPTKSRTVDVGNYCYSYAELPAVLDAVRGPLATNGLSLLQPVEVRGTHVRVWTMLLHLSGEWIRTALVLTADSPKAQAIGSAITYGRRYGLSAMLGIAADDDEDGALASSAPTPTPTPTAAPRTAARPHPVPAPVPVTVESGHGYVTDVVAKDGESKDGRPWRNFKITFDDGRVCSTFDSKIGELAQRARSEGWEVRRVLTPSSRNAKFNDLTSLEPVHVDEPADDVEPAEGEPVVRESKPWAYGGGDDEIPF